jgi:uncharacterized protein
MAIDYGKNINTVKDLYSAINRRDFPAILSYLDENIDWQSPATSTMVKEIFWSKPRHGKGEVSAFFNEVRGKLTLDEMSYTTIIADGDCVVAEGTMRGSVNSTGCFFRANFAMVFTLRNGKIVHFRNYYDSAEIAAALLAKGEECRAVLKAA